MFVPDMPNVPPQSVPVMIAQANQAQSNNVTKTPVFGVCQPAPSKEYNGDNTLSPIVAAQSYFYAYEQKTVTGPATVTILQQPKHGILRMLTEADRGTLFSSSSGPIDPADACCVYLPEQGYGKDSATLLVDFGGGLKVKVVFFFQQHEGPLGNTGLVDLCEKTGVYWKISSTLDPNGNSTLTSVDYLPSFENSASVTGATLASVLGKGLASSLDANTSGITLNIADLPGGAVGQTTGTSITLDTNAAGYGWYIDPNPAANTDFLPTSNPDVWMAKAGSAAAGKMDMLSVLLHEYGHALGLDHSVNPNDFMAPDLQPGERRLPSASELAQLSQLATQLASTNNPAAPDSPTSPTLPVGTALSALLIGRLRRTNYGSTVPMIDSVQIPAPKLELAINSTLTNGNFAGGAADWNAYGNVTTNSTGTATLKNSTGADAQLAQAFNLTSQERYLEFTVANGLQQNGIPHPNLLPGGEGANGAASGSGSGPNDAFEVALDNAVTGTALVGTDGLTNSDSLLNIQADGTTSTASSVYRSVNPDGTTTYVIDLQGALTSGAVTGTPAALSFDLIGFGNSHSQVSIRDIQLLHRSGV